MPSISLKHLDEEFAYLLGYFVGDGNFTKSGIGFTTGDAEIVERLTGLLRGWGCNPRVKYDLQNNRARWRIAVHSRTLRELLIAVGLSPERKARQKIVPPIVLQSPARGGRGVSCAATSTPTPTRAARG
jgi:intein/homing endonuclease